MKTAPSKTPAMDFILIAPCDNEALFRVDCRAGNSSSQIKWWHIIKPVTSLLAPQTNRNVHNSQKRGLLKPSFTTFNTSRVNVNNHTFELIKKLKILILIIKQSSLLWNFNPHHGLSLGPIILRGDSTTKRSLNQLTLSLFYPFPKHTLLSLSVFF